MAATGNPALHPPATECRSRDIMLVINPIRHKLLTRPEEIADRVNEITFKRRLVAGNARHRFRQAYCRVIQARWVAVQGRAGCTTDGGGEVLDGYSALDQGQGFTLLDPCLARSGRAARANGWPGAARCWASNAVSILWRRTGRPALARGRPRPLLFTARPALNPACAAAQSRRSAGNKITSRDAQLSVSIINRSMRRCRSRRSAAVFQRG
jgi:hypothetical protein